MKILLIEDDDLDARAIERLLRRLWNMDCSLVRAATLADGLAAIEAEKPDAALLDLGLPDAQGLEAIREITAKLPDRPVIVLTGDSDAGKDLTALAAGAADYLIKRQITVDLLARTLSHSLERKRSERRIREQAELLDRANEGIIACSASGDIGYSNAGAQSLLGEAENGNVFAMVGFSEEQISRLLSELHSSGGAVIEVELQSGDGPVINLVSRWSRSSDAETGHDRELFAILADITERRKMSVRIREAQKLESLGALAGGIAHDFNNLLAAILGNVGLVKSEQPETSEEWDMLNECEIAAERAADLCSQMLAYAGRGRLVSQPVNLGALTTGVADLLRISIAKTTRLNVRLDKNLPTIDGDPAQLKQLFTNLIINASEAIGDSAGEIEISGGLARVDEAYLKNGRFLAELPPGDYASVRVSDTGPGMDAATLDKVFDPFFSTKFTGRGLGLASVQGVIRVHEGALSVRSKTNEGTTFEVLLPATATATKSTAPSAPPKLLTVPAKPDGIVLVVDDEEHVRKAAQRILNKQGLEVALASHGAEGVLEFERRAAQLKCVLLDLTMPHMDGVEAHKLMRAIDPDVPILLMSGYTEQTVTARFGDSELAGFIHKPFRAEELIERIRAATEAAHAG